TTGAPLALCVTRDAHLDARSENHLIPGRAARRHFEQVLPTAAVNHVRHSVVLDRRGSQEEVAVEPFRPRPVEQIRQVLDALGVAAPRIPFTQDRGSGQLIDIEVGAPRATRTSLPVPIRTSGPTPPISRSRRRPAARTSLPTPPSSTLGPPPTRTSFPGPPT